MEEAVTNDERSNTDSSSMAGTCLSLDRPRGPPQSRQRNNSDAEVPRAEADASHFNPKFQVKEVNSESQHQASQPTTQQLWSLRDTFQSLQQSTHFRMVDCVNVIKQERDWHRALATAHCHAKHCLFATDSLTNAVGHALEQLFLLWKHLRVRKNYERSKPLQVYLSHDIPPWAISAVINDLFYYDPFTYEGTDSMKPLVIEIVQSVASDQLASLLSDLKRIFESRLDYVTQHVEARENRFRLVLAATHDLVIRVRSIRQKLYRLVKQVKRATLLAGLPEWSYQFPLVPLPTVTDPLLEQFVLAEVDPFDSPLNVAVPPDLASSNDFNEVRTFVCAAVSVCFEFTAFTITVGSYPLQGRFVHVREDDDSFSASVLHWEQHARSESCELEELTCAWMQPLDRDLNSTASQSFQAHTSLDYLETHLVNLSWQFNVALNSLVRRLEMPYIKVFAIVDGGQDLNVGGGIQESEQDIGVPSLVDGDEANVAVGGSEETVHFVGHANREDSASGIGSDTDE